MHSDEGMDDKTKKKERKKKNEFKDFNEQEKQKNELKILLLTKIEKSSSMHFVLQIDVFFEA